MIIDSAPDMFQGEQLVGWLMSVYGREDKPPDKCVWVGVCVCVCAIARTCACVVATRTSSLPGLDTRH